MPIPDSCPVPGALLLGVDGSRDRFVTIRAATDDPNIGGVTPGALGDVIVRPFGTGRLYQHNGTDWTELTAPAPATTIYYKATSYGIVAGSDTSVGAANNAALLALIATVKAAGGGTIFFPAGTYHFSIVYDGGLSPANRSIYLQDQGRMNVRFLGEGPGTKLVWGGDAGQGGGGGGAAHFFYIRGQTSYVTFESMKILQRDLTNPDPGAEQHHLIRLQADRVGNCQHVKFINCEFGLVKGDAINCSGGFGSNRIKVAYPSTSGAGAVPSLSDTSPAGLLPGEGMRVAVEFSNTWDGGSFTFTGTEPNGRTISETISKQNPGLDTVAGYREFATITGVTYSGGGTLGTADLGYTYVVQFVDIVGCRFNGFEHAAGSPPGYGYRSAVGVQRLSLYITVLGCWMTGCDDQLIDFEPTGNGYLGPWFIVGNTFMVLAAAPSGGADTSMSFFGNANKFPCERSTVAFNRFIGGGIIGGKLRGCDITNNYMWIPEDARLLMQFTDRMEDVRITDNWIEALGPNIGDVTAPCISMIAGGSTTVPDYPDGVTIARNTCHWFCLAATNQLPAIRVTAGRNLRIYDNVLVNYGTASNVDVAAIKIENSAVDLSGLRIERNSIEANRGGGSIQRGIDIVDRPTKNWTNITIRDNQGVGVTTTGINLRDPNGGSYVNPPVVEGNSFPGATNLIVLGTGVIIRIGGNGGNAVGIYSGAPTDPATDTDLDNVGIGSQFNSMGTGGDMYLKTAAGSAGWKKVTHA